MASFSHYATFDESMAILRDVAAAQHLKIIPDEPALATPELETFAHFSPKVAEKLAKHGVLDLEGAFTKHPLAFRKIANGTYYRDEIVGPRLTWSLPKVSSKRELLPGLLTYHKAYRTPDGGIEPPSAELKQAYADVVKAMKQHMTSVKARGQTYWIGRETKRQVDAGELVFSP